MPFTQAEARPHIAALVAQFRADEAALAGAPEAQIEDVYLKPLFRYLNWNVSNTGLPRAEWEFVVQATTEKGKRPDYVLQLDGQHLLVMDAKQVKYSMRDPRWVNQVYAYAYSTQNAPAPRKIDFAILTDFQEFVLLDCTFYAGDPKAVNNFRVLDWTCDDFVAQFDTLWELFERENLRQAAAARGTDAPRGLFARYLSPKKVKANRLPPDRAFLAEMDDEKTGWRVLLAKDMKKRNPGADGALITAAVQLLIDRLIFVKALSDREIEDDYLTQLAETVERAGLAESDTGWFAACRAIFQKLNQFYDGSIFEQRPELEAVAVSNQTVRDILRALQPENSPYNFAVLPVEILGTIYERFLGRVVRATDQRVKIEEKPEVRKAGGVYYTPQYIVDYIVQNTVGQLLETCRTPADAAQLKIVDPACGSGSFLLGAYDALIKWHEQYFNSLSPMEERGGVRGKRDREAFYLDADGRVRLTARLKRQILLNNLYGVDIDAQAVEVTRFSLSLKALEDTRRAELYEERTLFQQTVLPNLSANIKHGNSLIGPDYFTGSLFPDPAELRRVNPFDWAREFPQVFAPSPPAPSPRLQAGERGIGGRGVGGEGGFDAVIGNPPYGASFSEREAAYFSQKYTVFKGIKDVYTCFIETSLSALKTSGRFSFIVPSAWLGGPEYKELRELILSHQVENVILLPFDVFADAYVDTAIFVVSRERPSADHQVLTHVYGKREKLSRIEVAGDNYKRIYQHEWATTTDKKFVLDPGTVRLLDRIRQKSVATFDDVVQLKRGVLFDKGFLTSKRTSKNSHRYFEGDVYRYELNLLADKWIEFDDRMKERPKEVAWFEGVRILLRRLVNRRQRLMATLALETFITNKNLYSGLPKSDFPRLEAILGMLNSRLISYLYINQVTQATKDDFPQVTIKDVLALPFPELDKARHDRLVQLVTAMLELHKHKAAASTQTEQDLFQRQIDATDRQIDARVYELYGLTEAEIAIVEGDR